MFERSETKVKIFQVLQEWNPNIDGKATAYMIAKKIGASEGIVNKILRYLRDEGLVKKSSGGAYHL